MLKIMAGFLLFKLIRTLGVFFGFFEKVTEEERAKSFAEIKRYFNTDPEVTIVCTIIAITLFCIGLYMVGYLLLKPFGL